MAKRVLLLGVLLVLVAVPAAAAPRSSGDLPAVARPRYMLDDQELGSGTVFFLPVSQGAGAVAVGAAHSFDFDQLGRAGTLDFRLGRSGRRVAVSSGYFAEPGRPFADVGGKLSQDYVVFALDTPPFGVRLLEPVGPRSVSAGDRVKILGVPASGSSDQESVLGTVLEVGSDRIELDLDRNRDLRGWGGAPVLLQPGGQVIGLLEAAWPDRDKKLRLGVAPLTRVTLALNQPLGDGFGAPFERYAGRGGSRSARTQPSSKRPSQRPAQRPQQALSRPAPRPPEGETLMGKAGATSTELKLEIEHPPDGSVVGDRLGTFVAGRAVALAGDIKRFDVIFVLDTSGSAAQMSGADINGNGILGQGGLRGLFGKTDPGDSVLAAEVMAAREILKGLDPRSTRVGIVTFAGEPPRGGGVFRRRAPDAAITEVPLTSDHDRVERALARVLDRGADGMTHMAAGVDQATIELLGLRGALSEADPDAERVVLFFTDGQPTLPYDPIFEADNVKAVLRAADRAARAGVRIHSFAIGPEALEGPIATVEMANRTDGYFTPVRQPGDLVQVIENVSFANIDELEVRNLDSGGQAQQVLINADGSWSALIPLEPGKNRIRVEAHASDGSTASSQVMIQYAPDAPSPELPRELVSARNRLLEQRLLELKRGRIDAEQRAAEAMRQELKIEIDRERAEARSRAERQRRELDLEVERQASGGAEPDA